MTSKNRNKFISYLLVFVMVIALILSFDKLAEWIGEMTGIEPVKIKDMARTTLVVAIGLYLIHVGMASLVVPVLGISLMAVGAVLIAWVLYPFFKDEDPRSEG